MGSIAGDLYLVYCLAHLLILIKSPAHCPCQTCQLMQRAPLPDVEECQSRLWITRHGTWLAVVRLVT